VRYALCLVTLVEYAFVLFSLAHLCSGRWMSELRVMFGDVSFEYVEYDFVLFPGSLV
jgi:hypothetical protein